MIRTCLASQNPLHSSQGNSSSSRHAPQHHAHHPLYKASLHLGKIGFGREYVARLFVCNKAP